MNKNHSQHTICFQGISGAYSHIAAKHLFPQAKITGYKTFRDVFQSVKQIKSSMGVLPIENTLAGSVVEVYDLLTKYQLPIVREVNLRIEHHLLTLPQVDSLSILTHVHSHPKALEQCQDFLKNHPRITQVAEFDTAGSAEIVQKLNNPHHAAIASRTAGKIWKLKILQPNVESNPQNFTRFLVISPTPITNKSQKTSLLISLHHTPGTLNQALSPFAQHGINLTKIESRPLIGSPWEYCFYLDLEASTQDSNFQQALGKVQQVTVSLRILGSYPKGDTITEPL